MSCRIVDRDCMAVDHVTFPRLYTRREWSLPRTQEGQATAVRYDGIIWTRIVHIHVNTALFRHQRCITQSFSSSGFSQLDTCIVVVCEQHINCRILSCSIVCYSQAFVSCMPARLVCRKTGPLIHFTSLHLTLLHFTSPSFTSLHVLMSRGGRNATAAQESWSRMTSLAWIWSGPLGELSRWTRPRCGWNHVDSWSLSAVYPLSRHEKSKSLGHADMMIAVVVSSVQLALVPTGI